MDETPNALTDYELDQLITEARERLAGLAEFGIKSDQHVLNECHRLAEIGEAKRLLETSSPKSFNIPTTPQKPPDDIDSYISYIFELYKRFFGEYPDIKRMTEEKIMILWEWYDLLSSSKIRHVVSMHEDYSIEASIHIAVRSELANITENIASSENEDKAIEELNHILEIVYKIKPEQMKYYQYLGGHFGRIVKQARDKRWTNFLNIVYKNEEVLFMVFRDKSGIQPDDIETEYAVFMGLSEEDKAKIRQENWKSLDGWLNQRATKKFEITIQDIVEIHRQATKGILPNFTQGIRSENVHCGQHKAPEVKKMQEELQRMLQKANELCTFKGPSALFLYKLAEIAVDYAQIHPHSDGNGTAGLVFCELIARIHGMKPADITSPSYVQRIRNIFRNNPVALTYLALKEQEIFHKKGTIESLIKVFRSPLWTYR